MNVHPAEQGVVKFLRAALRQRARSVAKLEVAESEQEQPLLPIESSIFHDACMLGLEGIVSKRKDSGIVRAARRIGSRARTRTHQR
jgi:hypothetical protein